jgi:hypothetical protein
MSRNVCGNCANFKPPSGVKFFNCTYAKHAGASYRMQVRPDTASCDAFKPIQTERRPIPSKQVQIGENRPRLCPWVRLVILAAIILLLVLISWGVYSCVSRSTEPSNTPVASPAVTASPVPNYRIIGNYTLGQWAQIPGELGSVISAYKRYDAPGEIGNLGVPPGLAYIVITVTVASTGDRALPLQESHFLIQDATGQRWLPSLAYWSDYEAKKSRSLPAHQTLSLDLYFLVPNMPFTGSKLFWAFGGDQFKWTEWDLPPL